MTGPFIPVVYRTCSRIKVSADTRRDRPGPRRIRAAQSFVGRSARTSVHLHAVAVKCISCTCECGLAWKSISGKGQPKLNYLVWFSNLEVLLVGKRQAVQRSLNLICKRQQWLAKGTHRKKSDDLPTSHATDGLESDRVVRERSQDCLQPQFASVQ